MLRRTHAQHSASDRNLQAGTRRPSLEGTEISQRSVEGSHPLIGRHLPASGPDVALGTNAHTPVRSPITAINAMGGGGGLEEHERPSGNSSRE